MRKHALRAPRLMGVLLTVLPTAQCSANAGDIVTHHVPYWTDDYGYCKKLPGLDEGVHRRFGLERLHVKKGDRIAFTYSTHHDIWAHPTLEALESCDFSTATRIANTTEGGGCADEADLACMSAATPFILRPNTPGMLYLSCHVSDHCANGQRLVVQVHSSRPQPPAEVVVPLWTDDAGYCKPIPQAFPIGQHHGTHGLRPHGANREGGGLEPITIAYGQTLVFKYSAHHDVWQHPSAESLTACRYSDAVMLADTSQGGGCELDEDLECQRNSVGWKLTPTREQVGTKLFLSCSVGDHCSNGQTLVVTIADGPGPLAATASPASTSGGGGGQGLRGEKGDTGPMGPAGPAGAAGTGGVGMLLVGIFIGALAAAGASYAWTSTKRGGARPPAVREIPMGRPGASEDPRHGVA